MARKGLFSTGKDLKNLFEQGYHPSHIDGALLPPNVIDGNVFKQPEKPPLPTSRTLPIWVDKDGTHTKR